MTTKKSSNSMITVKQAAEILNLSRVRILGMFKQGKLEGTKGNIAGTTIPQILLSETSVRNYVPSRSSGTRAMVVKLPAEKLSLLEDFCLENGFELKKKNTKNYSSAIELDAEEIDELDEEEIEAA